jgi:hypothetical protein
MPASQRTETSVMIDIRPRPEVFAAARTCKFLTGWFMPQLLSEVSHLEMFLVAINHHS